MQSIAFRKLSGLLTFANIFVITFFIFIFTLLTFATHLCSTCNRCTINSLMMMMMTERETKMRWGEVTYSERRALVVPASLDAHRHWRHCQLHWHHGDCCRHDDCCRCCGRRRCWWRRGAVVWPGRPRPLAAGERSTLYLLQRQQSQSLMHLIINSHRTITTLSRLHFYTLKAIISGRHRNTLVGLAIVLFY